MAFLPTDTLLLFDTDEAWMKVGLPARVLPSPPSALRHLFRSALLAPLLAASAFAQPAPTGAEIAMYQGADRTARLIAGARAEGTLTIYGSAPLDDMAVLTDAFEKAYGVKVRVWRASSENVVQRGVVEARGGRFEVDIFETNDPEMEALHREKVLQEVKSPHLAELIPAAVPDHREWIGTRVNIFSAAYNTRLLRKEEVPRSYADLLDRKWKGKLGIEAEDLDWFAAVVSALGEADGLKLFRAIVAANGISVRKGHTLLTNLVISGEVPVALTVYQYKAAQLRDSGAPIDVFVLPPVVARFQGIGLARRAPHPYAAVLFIDFMLTQAQELLLKRDFLPANARVNPSLPAMDLTYIDPAAVLDGHDKWAKLYKEIFAGQSR
jgi:iron(III) transport system substrate-binding protein